MDYQPLRRYSPVMRAIILKVFAIAATCLASVSFTVFAEQSIEVEPEVLDFGRVNQGESVVGEFTVRNLGSAAKTIKFIDFSGPGLTARVNPNIEAGGSVRAAVYWNTAGQTGEVSGSITLMFDLKGESKIVLPIEGTVISEEAQ